MAQTNNGATVKDLTVIAPVSNDAKSIVAADAPFIVEFILRGTADLLFHRWSNEAVEPTPGKPTKIKGAKKFDDIESYVYRHGNGNIALPGEYVRMSLVTAAKSFQDPRSPRKSAMDLYKAAVVPLTHLADLGVKTWDYEDRRRVTIQRNAITRARPAIKMGWEATLQFQVLTPEYISAQDLHNILMHAGRLVGVGDFRPSYGRFCVASFETIELG